MEEVKGIAIINEGAEEVAVAFQAEGEEGGFPLYFDGMDAVVAGYDFGMISQLIVAENGAEFVKLRLFRCYELGNFSVEMCAGAESPIAICVQHVPCCGEEIIDRVLFFIADVFVR